MRGTRWTAMVLGLALSGPAWSQQRKSVDFNFEEQPDGFGIGFVLGDPSGISLAFRNGERSNVQAHFGVNTWTDRLHLSVDYLHNAIVFDSPETPGVVWPLYIGIGGSIDTDDRWGRTGVGIRIPFGLSMLPRSLAIDVFVELVPVLEIVPITDVDIDGGIGARIYF